MGLIQEITQVFSQYKGRAAVSHYVPPNSSMTLTYGQLGERAGEFARFLLKHGVRPGDFVICYMSKTVDLLVAILATMLNGGVCCCFYSKQNLQYAIRLFSMTNPKFVLLEENTLRNVMRETEKIGKNNQFLSCVKYPEAEGKGTSSQSQNKTIYVLKYPPRLSNRDQTVPTVRSGFGNAAWCLFTSGSTGVPKGVLISGEDLLQRAMIQIEDYEITNQDSLLSLLPFSFDVGLNELFSCFFAGARLVIFNSWFPKDILTAIGSQRITGISGVPSIWADMIAYPKGPDFEQCVQTLKYITVSGGDLSKNQLLQLRQYFRELKIFKTYGQTETFRSSILKPFDFEKKMTSVGRAVKGTQVFVLTEKGDLAPPNTEGEIVHYGVGTMLGYMNDLEGTNGKLRDITDAVRGRIKEGKLVFTGDLGKIDEEGYLYVLGREDGMIKTLGYRVYPKEIESYILEYEHVKNAAVVGVRDDRKGQAIIAEVVGNGALNEQRLMIFLKERLPYYMIPGEINIVEHLPMTESGKIKYTAIKEKYEARGILQDRS